MVSVCMASYNGAKYIKAQIDSILCQLGKNDELIISDDGSQDNTTAIIRAYNDNRIKLFTNSNAHNIARNFEHAIANAKGTYIFLCDQDDIWYDNKVSVCVELLNQYDLVVSDCNVVNDNLEITDGSYFAFLNAGPGLIRNLRSNSFLGCCMCFNSRILPLVMPFPKSIPMHDIWIGFVVTLFGTVKFINKPLMSYRRHTNTVTHQKLGQSKYNFAGKIRNRINVLKYVPLLIERSIKAKKGMLKIS